jgi:tetratricopeptide (TPR) repeat protein
MKMTTQTRQTATFLLILAVAALLAVTCYHRFRPEWVLYRKGERLLAKQDYRGAIPYFVASLAKRNTNPDILENLGRAYSATGRFPEAVDAYRTYLSHNPDNRDARIQLARALSWSGRYNEAAIEYKIALGDHP